MEAKYLNIEKIFRQAYVIGGSPCCGKSTIAEYLAKEFNFEYYKIDDHEKEHSERCQPDRHPTMFKYSKMCWNEIWMRPVSYQVQELIEYYQERFEMIIEDLEKYDLSKPIILEGAALLPKLVDQYNVKFQNILFMVPTKQFQLNQYSKRKWIHEILNECEDLEQAFSNWMMRDQIFSEKILSEAKVRNYWTILVDGSNSIDENYKKVKDYFKI
jgi:2-phosphoglycerate kinase